MVNKAILMGRVGRDPEIRNVQSGGKVASFSLATSENWRDRDGEWQERTQWHNVVVWNEGTVKYVQNNVQKGDLIYVEGQIEYRKWEDRDGNERHTTEIVIRPYNGTLRKVPTGKGGRDDDKGGRRSSDDRDRRRDRDDDDRRSSGYGGGRSGYMDDDDDAIPF